VVAPERDRSGASNSLTLDRPLIVRRAPNGYFSVNGTPTDCVHIAVTGFLEFTPDVVVSGINLGANMGDDTIYSGTVAAAAEGYLLGIPALAVSLTSRTGEHFDSAIGVALQIVERFKRSPFSEPLLLNVNVADVPPAELRAGGVAGAGPRRPGRGAAAPVRRGGAAEPRLRGYRAADRFRPDHFAALRRRSHDRSIDRAENCKKNPRGRHRLRLPGGRAGEHFPRGLLDRAHQGAARARARESPRPAAQESASRARRRLRRSREGGAVPVDHRRGGGAPDSGCPVTPARSRWQNDIAAARRQFRARGAAAGADRAQRARLHRVRARCGALRSDGGGQGMTRAAGLACIVVMALS